MTLLRVILLTVLLAQPLAAQEAGTAAPSYVINLRDADIRLLAEQVSDITRRTLVLDPNVTGIVTVISTQPLDKDGVGTGATVSNPVAGALAPDIPAAGAAAEGAEVRLVAPALGSFSAEEITIQPVLESSSIVVRARAEVQRDLALLIADLVTNRRSIKTTVLADNGGTIVLGGLITDDRQSARSEVPGLGKVPIIGGLFRTRSEQARRQTLFVFLRPTILRSRADVSAVSENRFQRLKAIEATPQAGGMSGSILGRQKNIRRLPVEIDGLY